MAANMLVSILSLAAGFALAHRSIARRDRVVHEVRQPDARSRSARIPGHATLPLRIGLTQQNLDVAYERLSDLSDPSSPNYGKWLSAQEVHDFFSPSEEAVQAVMEWLIDGGVNASSIVPSANKGWIAIDLLTQQVEELLETEFYEYSHPDAGHVGIGCEAYSLPASLRQHVDYVKPGVILARATRKEVTRRSAA